MDRIPAALDPGPRLADGRLTLVPRPHLLTIVGNACADACYRLAALPQPGETVIATGVTGDLGGKGLNQAVAAARAGVVPQFIAPVGCDAVADRIAAALHAEGIDAHDLIRRNGVSDTSLILTDQTGENVIVSDTRQAEGVGFDEIVPHLHLSPGHLLLLQGNLSRRVTLAAISAAQAAGTIVALNAAPMRPWLRGVNPDLLIVNQGEAAAIAGLPVHASPEAILASLASPVVAITLGAAGCLLRDHGETVRVAAPAVSVHDSAGAGDVFCGVFIAEWLSTGNSAAAARLAVLAASAKVERSGTLSAFPARSEIDRLRHAFGPHPASFRSISP